jgi:hypothetical protein
MVKGNIEKLDTYTMCQQTHTMSSFKHLSLHCSLGQPHDILLLIFVHSLRERNLLSSPMLELLFQRFSSLQ